MPPANALEISDLSSPAFLCAWCRDPIGSTDSVHREPGNFGICPSCLESQLALLGSSKPSSRMRKRTANGPAVAIRAAR